MADTNATKLDPLSLAYAVAHATELCHGDEATLHAVLAELMAGQGEDATDEAEPVTEAGEVAHSDFSGTRGQQFAPPAGGWKGGKRRSTLLESQHRFSCALLDLTRAGYSRSQCSPLPKLDELAESIPDEILTDDGRETDRHVTVKFGLHTQDADDVRRVVEGLGPITIRFGGVSIFPAKAGADYDVVKVDVQGNDIRRLNQLICDALPHTDTHPTFNPHCTLAYVEPGTGGRFVGPSGVEGMELTLDELVFSDKDGKRTRIPLVGTPLREAVESVDDAGDPHDGEAYARLLAGVLNALAMAGEDSSDLADELSEELEPSGWMLTRHPRGLWLATAAADPGDVLLESVNWDETKHPRANDGKFGSGGSGNEDDRTTGSEDRRDKHEQRLAAFELLTDHTTSMASVTDARLSAERDSLIDAAGGDFATDEDRKALLNKIEDHAARLGTDFGKTAGKFIQQSESLGCPPKHIEKMQAIVSRAVASLGKSGARVTRLASRLMAADAKMVSAKAALAANEDEYDDAPHDAFSDAEDRYGEASSDYYDAMHDLHDICDSLGEKFNAALEEAVDVIGAALDAEGEAIDAEEEDAEDEDGGEIDDEDDEEIDDEDGTELLERVIVGVDKRGYRYAYDTDKKMRVPLTDRIKGKAKERLSAKHEAGHRVDHAALADRLARHHDGEANAYTQGNAVRAARAMKRHHGEHAAARVEELTDRLEEVLGRLADADDTIHLRQAKAALTAKLKQLGAVLAAMGEVEKPVEPADPITPGMLRQMEDAMSRHPEMLVLFRDGERTFVHPSQRDRLKKAGVHYPTEGIPLSDFEPSLRSLLKAKQRVAIAEPEPQPNPVATEPAKEPAAPTKMLSTGDVAKHAQVAPRTVSKWVDSGVLPGERDPVTGNRTVREDDLVAFFTDHGMQVPDALVGVEPAADYLDRVKKGKEEAAARVSGAKQVAPVEPAREPKAKEPWEMTAAEAVRSGKTHGEWSDGISRAFVDEKINDDHPAYRELQNVSVDDYVDAKSMFGKHAVTEHGRDFGVITDISSDLKTATVRRADGSTFDTPLARLSHLGGWVASKRGGLPIDQKLVDYYADVIAKEVDAGGKSVSDVMRAHGMDPVKDSQVRKAVVDLRDKQSAERAAKEPWQLTGAEFKGAPTIHRMAVQKAVAEGKPVPDNVLADVKFTGTDSLGRKWVNGEMVAAEVPQGGTEDASQPADGSNVKPVELTRDEIRKLLAEPGDRYKDAGLQKTEVKGQSRYSGDTIYGYPYSPQHFEKSHATGRPIRHYVKLPDGQIVHPDELRDAIRRGRVKIKATPAEMEQAERSKDWREAIRSAHLHTRKSLTDKALAANVTGSERAEIMREHRTDVERALAKGEYVPSEVLADYPDLSSQQADAPAVSGDEWKQPIRDSLAAGITVYRGTGRGKPNDHGVAGKGAYHSGDEQVARAYGDTVTKSEVRLANPLIATYSELNALQEKLYGRSLTEFEPELSEKFDGWLREQGYDGVAMFDHEISKTVPQEVVKLADTPSVPAPGTPAQMNREQYLKSIGMTWDPMVDAIAMSSPAGRISDRAAQAAYGRFDDNMEKYKAALSDYQRLVDAGKIIDPDGRVKPTKVEDTAEYRQASGRAAQLARSIQDLRNIGVGKRGKIRPSIQAELDRNNSELQRIVASYPDLAAKHGVVNQSADTPAHGTPAHYDAWLSASGLSPRPGASALTPQQQERARQMYQTETGASLPAAPVAQPTPSQPVAPAPAPSAIQTRVVDTSRGKRHVHSFRPSEAFWQARKAGKLPDSVTVRKNDQTGAWEASIWGASPDEVAATHGRLSQMGIVPSVASKNEKTETTVDKPQSSGYDSSGGGKQAPAEGTKMTQTAKSFADHIASPPSGFSSRGKSLVHKDTDHYVHPFGNGFRVFDRRRRVIGQHAAVEDALTDAAMKRLSLAEVNGLKESDKVFYRTYDGKWLPGTVKAEAPKHFGAGTIGTVKVQHEDGTAEDYNGSRLSRRSQ